MQPGCGNAAPSATGEECGRSLLRGRARRGLTVRIATCRCGRLRATCVGEPVRVSVCHCLDCQRRSGSAFSAQARWPVAQVSVTGDSRIWSPDASAQFHFCPGCGGTIAFTIAALPGLVAIPVGAFADPGFPPPAFSLFENRQHPWLAITGEGVEHD